MKGFYSSPKLIFTLILSIILLSCSSDDNGAPPPEDTEEMGGTEGTDGNENSLMEINDYLNSQATLSTLVTAIAMDMDFSESLQANGVTLFAPTNTAFTELLAQLDGFSTLEDFDTQEELELLGQILSYHIIASTFFASDLTEGTELETLESATLSVAVNDGTIELLDNTAETTGIVDADNEVTNGVVHIVDKVLLPPDVVEQLFPTQNVVELIATTEELSLLEEAVLLTDLTEDLSEEGPFTIFAPTNAAIEALFDQLGEGFNSFEDFDNFLEIQILKRILEYHIVPQNLASEALSEITLNTLLEGESFDIVLVDGTFQIDDASELNAEFINVDNRATNGLVHIIDKILISQEVQDFLEGLDVPPVPATIADLVTANEDLELLEEALRVTGLLDTLSEDGPFTVFAPSNTNFLQLLAIVGITENENIPFDFDQLDNQQIDLLRDVLLFHVLGESRSFASFMADETLVTLAGDNTLEVIERSQEVNLVDATGLAVGFDFTDIMASNGVIHVVDRVMVPESLFISLLEEAGDAFVDLLEELPDHSIGLTALYLFRDNLGEFLNGTAPFTFFLPSNNAFLELFGQIDGIDSLLDFDTLEELIVLTTILTYHIVPDTRLASTDFQDGGMIETLQGESLTIALGPQIQILDKTTIPALVTQADTNILNGLVHGIDKVLLPQDALNAL